MPKVWYRTTLGIRTTSLIECSRTSTRKSFSATGRRRGVRAGCNGKTRLTHPSSHEHVRLIVSVVRNKSRFELPPTRQLLCPREPSGA
jgi:hypothetical protein